MAIASHARMDSTSTILPQRFQRVMPLCCVSVTSMRQVRQLGLLTQPQNFAVSTIDKRWRSLLNRLHVPTGVALSLYTANTGQFLHSSGREKLHVSDVKLRSPFARARTCFDRGHF